MSADRRTATVELDPSVYRLEAIKKAAYKFGDRCFVQIDTDANGRVAVTLKAKRVLMDDVEQLAGEFRNEVLDQELREVVELAPGAGVLQDRSARSHRGECRLPRRPAQDPGTR